MERVRFMDSRDIELWTQSVVLEGLESAIATVVITAEESSWTDKEVLVAIKAMEEVLRQMAVMTATEIKDAVSI
jgi:hypothetical protein